MVFLQAKLGRIQIWIRHKSVRIIFSVRRCFHLPLISRHSDTCVEAFTSSFSRAKADVRPWNESGLFMKIQRADRNNNFSWASCNSKLFCCSGGVWDSLIGNGFISASEDFSVCFKIWREKNPFHMRILGVNFICFYWNLLLKFTLIFLVRQPLLYDNSKVFILSHF